MHWTKADHALYNVSAVNFNYVCLFLQQTFRIFSIFTTDVHYCTCKFFHCVTRTSLVGHTEVGGVLQSEEFYRTRACNIESGYVIQSLEVLLRERMINRVGCITNSIGVLYRVWSCCTMQVFSRQIGMLYRVSWYYIKWEYYRDKRGIIENWVCQIEFG